MEKALISDLLFSVADSYCVDIDSPVCQAHCLCIGEVRDRVQTVSGPQHEAAWLELPTDAVAEKNNLTDAHEVFSM